MRYVGLSATQKDETYYIQGAYAFQASQYIGNTQSTDHSGKNLNGVRFHDTQTGMPFGIPKGARCVQRFDDSLNSAIHITYRNSLRSSSMREPRDPLLKVLFN